MNGGNERERTDAEFEDRVQAVACRLMPPLVWRTTNGGEYWRGDVRCCNDYSGRYVCTLLPGHAGPHQATDMDSDGPTWAVDHKRECMTARKNTRSRS